MPYMLAASWCSGKGVTVGRAIVARWLAGSGDRNHEPRGTGMTYTFIAAITDGRLPGEDARIKRDEP